MDISGVVSEDNALSEKLLKRAWLIVAAFFVGRCQIFEINPFLVGFLIAVCIIGERYIACAVSLMLGILSGSHDINVARYAVISVLVLLLMNIKQEKSYRWQKTGMAVLASVSTALVNYTWYVLFPDSILLPAVFAEAAIAFSLAMIYSHAIQTIINDYVRIAIENEAAISAVALAATVLCGMPVTAFGGIVVAEAFGLFSILYAMYRFGFGIGISWTTIAGAIMSARTGNDHFLTNWMIIAVASFAVICALKGGRFVYGICFAVIYYLCGFIFYQPLLSENSQKALVSALLIFLLLPSGWIAAIDERVKNGEMETESAEWAGLVMKRISNLAKAFKRIDYTMARDAEAGIGFSDVGNIIDDFTSGLSNAVPIRKTIEAKIVEELGAKEISVKNLLLTKNSDGRYEVYITIRCLRGKIIVSDTVRKIVEKHIGLGLVLKEDSRAIVGRQYDVLCMEQKPEFECQVAVKTLSRYEEQVSGDNFYVGDIRDGRKLLMIADGMGNGERADTDSRNLLDALEELLMAGFDKEMSIRIVNSYLAQRNKGESFATLDMLIIDLHTGYGSLYKQGAAATYIKRDEWIEIVKSTSLPVGVVEGADCESCRKKLYDGDMIVMLSDGVLESIVFENKEEYLKDMLLTCDNMDADEVAAMIMDEVKASGGNRLKDDATIIVSKLVKTL